MSHAERKYLASIYHSSGTVRVHTAQTDSAWSRAKWFVSTYATDSIIEMSDTTITTKVGSFFERMFWHMGYGYSVSRRTPQDSIIRIGVIPPAILVLPQWSHNGEILANYIETGSLPFPELIEKYPRN